MFLIFLMFLMILMPGDPGLELLHHFAKLIANGAGEPSKEGCFMCTGEWWPFPLAFAVSELVEILTKGAITNMF